MCFNFLHKCRHMLIALLGLVARRTEMHKLCSLP
jgi:hypothetical protein